jgi:predicted TIM-barrel fold metal-dependent hydrolase
MRNKSDIRIDSHVHVLGDGSSGSGCWLKIEKVYHKLLAQLAVRGMGLPSSSLDSGLDNLYAEMLAKMVRESSVTAAIILAHENVYDDNGKIVERFGAFYTPNDYVLSLAKTYSDCFIPAVSIHPGRPDALDELDRCIELGSAMLKLLPNCQNVNCSDRRFTKFWEKLSSAHIPFLAHTGGELSVSVYNKAYADPTMLTLPLECGVNVIAAHCGTRALFFDPNYLPTFLKMTEKYSNLYGDNSGMNTPLRSAYFPALLDSKIQERIIHGSDLPIPISATWNFMRGNVSMPGWKSSQDTKNMIERDARIKAALGFQTETFSRVLSLLPPNVVKRLQEH